MMYILYIYNINKTLYLYIQYKYSSYIYIQHVCIYINTILIFIYIYISYNFKIYTYCLSSYLPSWNRNALRTSRAPFSHVACYSELSHTHASNSGEFMISMKESWSTACPDTRESLVGFRLHSNTYSSKRDHPVKNTRSMAAKGTEKKNNKAMRDDG